MTRKFGILALVGISFALQSVSAHSDPWKETRPEDHVEQLDGHRAAPEEAEFDAYQKRVVGAIDKGNVAALEKMASEAWKARGMFPSGHPRLVAFYEAINALGSSYKASEEDKWAQLFTTIGGWEQAYPSSPFAKLARTKLLISQAWVIRGSGYSNSVSGQAMATFESRNEEVAQRLMSSRQLNGVIPEWYVQMIETGKNLSAPLDEMTALVDEGLRSFPDFYEIATIASKAYLPKWGGSDEQFAQFASHVKDTAPQGYGSMLYARIYYEASCCDYFDGLVFTQGHADWPSLKEGLESLRKRHPDAYNEDREAYFACSALDAQILPGLMAKIGKSPDPQIWKLTKFFRGCQEEAKLMKLHPDGPRSEWFPHT